MAKTPVKFLLGKETSDQLKATEAGRLYFAGAISAQDTSKDVFKIYYDTGEELVPMSAKEADYATAAKKDAGGNLLSSYATTLELIDNQSGGDTLRLKDRDNNTLSSIIVNEDVNQIVTTSSNNYPLIFGYNTISNSSSNINEAVRMNNRYYINPSSGKVEGITLDGGLWEVMKDPGCCFFPGTSILLNINGLCKNIEDIKPNEVVLSYNVTTKEFYEVIVQKLIVNENTTDIAIITFEDGRELKMNAYHPILTEKGFHSLTNHENYDTLIEGDIAKDAYLGWNKIVKIERYTIDKPIITYNLAIKDFNELVDDDTNDTFIANGIVVHNATNCPT